MRLDYDPVTLAMFQSVERICVPSNSLQRVFLAAKLAVSIRRTDLCAFELSMVRVKAAELNMFQSVERICVPSNCPRPRAEYSECIVSIRRTDLCAFERRTTPAPS